MESNLSNTDAVAALTCDANDHQQTQRLFGAFVEHYQQGVFGFLGRMGLSQADAEDVAQEVFLKAWRYRASYDAKISQPSTWLFTIARNTALSRRQKKHPEPISIEEIDPSCDKQHQPEQQLQHSQERAALSRAINQLSIEDRSAIALFYTEELSGAQAANILQCSNTAFKTRLSRARVKLKSILNSTHQTPPQINESRHD